MSAEIQLGWDNARLQAGARGATAIAQRTAAGMQAAFQRVQGINIGGLLAGSTAAVGLASIIKRGFEFNQTMGDSEVAIANVLQQMKGLNEEGAKADAAKAMRQIVELEPQTAASLTGLVDGLMATLGASAQVGMSVTENIDLVGRFANALANSNIPAEQLAQEMRSILTGNIGADSSLAKILNIKNEDVEKARSMGNLYGFLVDKLGTLGKAGDTARVAFSTLQSAIDKSAGALTKGLFGETVQGAKDLAEYLEKNQQKLVEVGESLKAFGSLSVSLFSAMGVYAEFAKARVDDIGYTLEEVMRKLLGLKSVAEKELEELKGKAGEIIGGTIAGALPGVSGKKAADITKQKTDEKAKSSGAAEAAELTKRMAEAAEVARRIEAERLQLAEKHFQVMLSHMTPLAQVEALQKRIKSLQEEAAGRDGPVHELERLRILQQVLDLQEKERAIRKGISDDAAKAKKDAEDRVKSERERQQEQKQALVFLDLEIGISEALAAGALKKAQAMERARDIAMETLRIHRETGITMDEAVKKATALVDAQKQGEKSTEKDGQIKGYSRERQGGAAEADARARARNEESRRRIDASRTSGLDEFYKKQQTPLRDTFKFPALDAYNALQNRSRPIGAPMPAADKKGGGMELPTVEGLLKSMDKKLGDLAEG